MAKVRPIIYVSKSISNWHEKIFKRYKAEEYIWWKHLFRSVTFFGLYRPWDYVLFALHRGIRICHWQGSDCLAAGWHYRWLQKIKAKHICETEVEQGVLRLMLQQEVEIRPIFLSNAHEFKINYKSSETPQVFIHINRKAELESGYYIIERIAPKVPEVTFHIFGRIEQRLSPNNIVFHGFVPEDQFNQEIKNYQAGLDLHVFSGFSEVIAKSILLGQYPISYVRYPHVDTFNNEDELVVLLRNLKNKKKPNYKARDYYMKEFLKYD